MAFWRLVRCAGVLAVVTALSAASAAAQAPVRVGGDIKEPIKIKHVSPAYPDMALQARVQGSVIIEAVIGKDGRVTDARVLRPVALLDTAAVEAVRQWEYTPTLLNGAPVDVIMTVVVNFKLSPESRPLAGSERPAPPDAFAEAEQMLLRALDQLRKQSSAASIAPKPIVVPPGYAIVEVTVATDGSVRDAKLIKGDPNLAAGALDAARNMRFTPTLLNGVPIEAVVTVLVPIRLPGR